MSRQMRRWQQRQAAKAQKTSQCVHEKEGSVVAHNHEPAALPEWPMPQSRDTPLEPHSANLFFELGQWFGRGTVSSSWDDAGWYRTLTHFDLNAQDHRRKHQAKKGARHAGPS